MEQKIIASASAWLAKHIGIGLFLSVDDIKKIIENLVSLLKK